MTYTTHDTLPYVLSFTLIDMEECSLGTHTCHEHATCTNTKGSFTCRCNHGYHGTGYKCIGKALSMVDFVVYLQE